MVLKVYWETTPQSRNKGRWDGGIAIRKGPGVGTEPGTCTTGTRCRARPTRPTPHALYPGIAKASPAVEVAVGYLHWQVALLGGRI